MLSPSAHPVIGFCMRNKKKTKQQFKMNRMSWKKIECWANLRFKSRNPEFSKTFRITIGVIVVNFHLRIFFIAIGIAGPFSSCVPKVMNGGTFGNKLGAKGAFVGYLPSTQSARIECSLLFGLYDPV